MFIHNQWFVSEIRLLRILIFASIILHLPGLWVDVMEIDAAQYAAISLEMSMTNQFLQVYEQGADYLDKPPLLFWLNALFFKAFGASNITFKLPSFIFSLIGWYSIYRVACIYSCQKVGLLAVLIGVNTLASFLMDLDVRTDNLLLGSVCFTFWMLSRIEAGISRNWFDFAFVGIGIGLAMLAKGPLGLVIPLLGFGGFSIWRKKWSFICSYGWLVSLAILALLLLPMCYGLYHQFDAQPEKWVLGRQGVSGLKFYFWEQSFGRITGESTWRDDTGIFFFLHTYLWAFFPWIIFLIPSLLKGFHTEKNGFQSVYWAFILTFIALSLSRFKLPHYIYVTIPFAALLVARWISAADLTPIYWRIITIAIGTLVILVNLVVLTFVFDAHWWHWIFFVIVPLLGMSIILLKIKNAKRLIVGLLVWSIWVLNIQLSTFFYPNLLTYQASSQLSKLYGKIDPGDEPWYLTGLRRNAVHFYSGKIMPRWDIQHLPSSSYIWVLVNKSEIQKLDDVPLDKEIVLSSPEFPVTKLNLQFLNKKTRHSVLDSTYLIQLKK